MIETWRNVDGWQNYEVSNLGRVRNKKSGRIKKRTLKLKPRYFVVCLTNGRSIQKVEFVHILVCRAFHGPKPTPLHQVAHWDGVNENCEAENLRWATPKENKEDSSRLGEIRRGSDAPNAKLTEKNVREIRERACSDYRGPNTALRMAKEFGVSRGTIRSVVARKSWKDIHP